MKTLNSRDFADLSDIFPQPYLDGAEPVLPPFDLPSVLVPPEVVEMDALSESSSGEVQVRREEWPEYHLILFDSDVIPFYPWVSFSKFAHNVLSIDRSRSDDACRLCTEVHSTRYNRHLRGQPKGMRPDPSRVPKVDASWNVSTKTQPSPRHPSPRSCPWKGLATREYRRGQRPRFYVRTPGFTTEKHVLHRFDHGVVQTFPLHCWTGCWKVDQEAV